MKGVNIDYTIIYYFIPRTVDSYTGGGEGGGDGGNVPVISFLLLWAARGELTHLTRGWSKDWQWNNWCVTALCFLLQRNRYLLICYPIKGHGVEYQPQSPPPPRDKGITLIGWHLNSYAAADATAATETTRNVTQTSKGGGGGVGWGEHQRRSCVRVRAIVGGFFLVFNELAISTPIVCKWSSPWIKSIGIRREIFQCSQQMVVKMVGEAQDNGWCRRLVDVPDP